jgi:hypothetical protein
VEKDKAPPRRFELAPPPAPLALVGRRDWHRWLAERRCALARLEDVVDDRQLSLELRDAA